MSNKYVHQEIQHGKGRTVLLTLGRLPKALDLARGLSSQGAQVCVAEPHRRTLTGLSKSVSKRIVLPAPRSDPELYRRALRDALAAEQVDWVVPVSEETLHVVPTLHSDQPKAPRVFGPTPEALFTLHDKMRFIELSRSLDWPVPDTVTADADRATELLATTATVLKGRWSCAGDGLEFLPPQARLPEAKRSPHWVLQAFKPGDLICSLTLSVNGTISETVAYRGRIMAGTVAVCFERIDENEPYREFSRRVAAATNFTGFLAFDFIDDGANPPWPIECNPRATSGLHFFNAADVAGLILTEDPEYPLRRAPHRLLQQFYAALTETQALMLRAPKQAARQVPLLWRAKDVTFQWRDPLPFWLMTYAAWPILSRTLTTGESFGSAATWDIEWQPEDEAVVPVTTAATIVESVPSRHSSTTESECP
ncbi:MAG: hypothetical protein AAF648_15075 [Pseudomonadota bacterium]